MEMELTKEICLNIVNMEDNDEAFDKTMELLNVYLKKYNDNINKGNFKDIIIETFKNETKLIFELLHTIFTKSIEQDEDPEDSDYEEDMIKFNELLANIRNVSNSIDIIDINNPNKEFSDSIQFISNYFQKAAENQQAISDSLESMNKTLTIFGEKLNYRSKLKTIIDKLNSDEELDNDFTNDSKKLCKEYLKIYDKEDVINVIKDFHLPSKPDYKEMYTKEEDLEVKKKYINYMEIDSILTVQLLLEKKTQNLNL